MNTSSLIEELEWRSVYPKAKQLALAKQANDLPTIQKILGPVAQVAGWKPGFPNSLIGGPSTLTAAISSGLLGAGLGYGTGWALESMAGKDKLNPGRLRKVLAGVGGAAGAAPALWAGYRGFFKQNEYTKQADLTGVMDFQPIIQKDPFNQMVWQDTQTPINIRAATSALLDGASDIRGGSAWVSPTDVARMALGMGAGWASGLVVGKALGALSGLNTETQRKLQQAGLWSGLLTQVVPLAFGR